METELTVLPERHRVRNQARWAAIGLLVLVVVAVVLAVVIGPSASAAGGCGGG